MKTLSGPRVIFPEGFDERAAFETPLKGWLNAQIELEGGCRYTVYFCDPITLAIARCMPPVSPPSPNEFPIY